MGRRPARDRCELAGTAGGVGWQSLGEQSRLYGAFLPRSLLIKFSATDGVELPGLLYEPDRRARSAAVWLHGTGGASIFESNRTNPIAHEFTSRGIAYLPFNNRGANLVRWLRGTKRPARGGMAYERIRDCVRDIDGAAKFLRSRGYRELYLIGHSTGANKIAVYDHYRRRNPFRKYVLLAGGDDTGMIYRKRTLERARVMIQSKRGDELAPPSATSMMISWRSLFDMMNPDGDYNVFPFLEAERGIRFGRKPLFRYIRGIRKPSLYVYGERDEYGPKWDILAEHVGPNAEIVVMKDANHGFSGRDAELGTLIAEWL